jgi:beta-galactosidase
VVSADLAKRLTEYVKKGGHLVLGPRTGMKNEFNALNRERQPGPLRDSVGARVEQFYALTEDIPVSGAWGNGKATVWAEPLGHLAPDAEVLLRFGAGNDWLTGEPAAVRRRLEKGTIIYLGSVLDSSLMASVTKQWITDAAVTSSVLYAPAGVKVSRRVGDGREVFVITNFSAGPQEIALPAAMNDVLNGGQVTRVNLSRYGVAVLTRPLH